MAARTSKDDPDVVIIESSGNEHGATWGQVDAAVDLLSDDLRRSGVHAGDSVVATGATSIATVLVILAAWRCGAGISVISSSLSRARQAKEMLSRAKMLGARTIYAEAGVWGEVPGRDAAAGVGLDDGDVLRRCMPVITAVEQRVRSVECGRWTTNDPPDDAVAIHQATSGTSRSPRIVPVTWGMLRANLRAIASRLDLTGDDSFVSWLPLYHDMGLIGYFALPVSLRARVTLMSSALYARQPSRFARLVERRRGTMSGSPTSGLSFLALGLKRGEDLDLSSLKRLVCGAEMIDLEVCERLLDAGRRHGLRTDVLAFAYGMAEASLAVSIRPPAAVAQGEDRLVDLSGSSSDGVWWRGARRGFARTGRPVPGIEVRVTPTDDGRCLPERGIGEIQIRGSSVMSGYVGHEARPPDRWLPTGDLGYLSDGEVVPVGRSKDILVVGGRNMVPEDVEGLVGELPGIRRGRVVAVPVKGRAGEGFGLLAERSAGTVAAESDVRVALRREFGVVPELVRFLPRGTLPKTTSGKLRRSACRELLT